jgi:MSHA pilin protein MshC
LKNERGFTIVELVMTIMIMGILAAVVGPRFFDRQVFDERLFFEDALAAVRYGQKLAVASGCPIRAQVGASGYALSRGAACGGGAVQNPSGGDYAAGLPSGVGVQQSLDVTFNSLGCVAADPAAPATCANDTRKSQIGSFSFDVHAATGFIEAAP